MLCDGAEAEGDVAGVLGDCDSVAGGVLEGLLGAAAGADSAGGRVLVTLVLAGVGVLATAGGFALCAGG